MLGVLALAGMLVGCGGGTAAGPAQSSGSVTVTPAGTTTYTLHATNQYGRSTATVTVTVQ